MVIFDFNFLGQGTPSPVNPLAYGMKVCVRAYGASALQFLKHFCRRLCEPKCRRWGAWGAQPTKTFKCGRAGGSYANLSAVGQGAYGGQSPLCRICSAVFVKNLWDVCNLCCVYI